MEDPNGLIILDASTTGRGSVRREVANGKVVAREQKVATERGKEVAVQRRGVGNVEDLILETNAKSITKFLEMQK